MKQTIVLAALFGAISAVKFDLAGVTTGPALPDAPAGNAPLAKPRGEKEWQAWAQDFVDWEDAQTDAANTRIPYASTFLQTRDIDDDEIAGMDGVHAVDKILMDGGDDTAPETVEGSVPIGTALIQLNLKENDYEKIENVLVQESADLAPREYGLAHIQNNFGDELTMFKRL